MDIFDRVILSAELSCFECLLIETLFILIIIIIIIIIIIVDILLSIEEVSQPLSNILCY